MAIKTVCPECDHPYRLMDDYAGATVRCRECSKTFEVPDAAADTSLKRRSPMMAMALTGMTAVVASVCLCGGSYGMYFIRVMLAGSTQPQAPPKKQPEQPKTDGDKKDAEKKDGDKKPADDTNKKPPTTEKSAEELLEDLKNPDVKIREKAFKDLAKLKDPAALPMLAEHLNDKADRKFASDALKAYGAPAEAEVLKTLGAADKAVRVEGCRILNKIGTKESLPALETAAKDKEKDVAKEATTAMNEVKKRNK